VSEPAAASATRRRSWKRRVAVLVLVLLVAYVLLGFVQVWRATSWDATSNADAIVVLGAAQYDGKPSPALRGRLDHAFALWTAQRGSTIVLTGSKRPGDRYTEAYAGFRYLRAKGVPEAGLVVVTTGTNTFDSLAATARVLHRRGMRGIIMVSDPYHSFRLVAIAEEIGFHDPQVSSTGTPAGFGRLVRESLVVDAGRIIGYRRVTRLLDG
jgi:vancomycin permeability regulator SanA